MTRPRILRIGVLALLVVLVAGGVVFRLSRFVEGPETPTEIPPASSSPAAADLQARIKARLYYVGPDGEHLIALEREVPLGRSPVEQGRRIVEAQIAPVAPPLVSAIPPGTALRAFFLTEDGRAVVDLSAEARARHPGGLTTELLTVYTIVDALTVNLPAITSVQLLVDGQPVESLAGHVDLRQPFRKDLAMVQTE